MLTAFFACVAVACSSGGKPEQQVNIQKVNTQQVDVQPHHLEQYYAGDAAWTKFVANFDTKWQQSQVKDELTRRLGGQVDLAKVVRGKMADDALALEWVTEAVPMLDDLTPQECAQSSSGTLRLREALMRMPD